MWEIMIDNTITYRINVQIYNKDYTKICVDVVRTTYSAIIN